MPIALLAPAQFDLHSVASALRQEGLDLPCATVAPAGVSGHAPGQCELAVLVVPTQGVVSIGEPTSVVRAALGPTARLIVCCPQPVRSDQERLHECGASDLITPRSWRPAVVAERILAELMLDDRVASCAFGGLLGGTRVMRALYETIEQVAPYSDPVLVVGETGTGKELAAREIHRCGERPEPFLPVDCASLPRELLENELFGHKRGAYTGAVSSEHGLLVEASGGTVFLDEIGELEPPSQAALLRAIEERRVRPVGSKKWHDVKARLVFATNRDLEAACAKGRFRQDLYERISGSTIYLPPLRNRRADIPLLAAAFLDQFNRENSRDCSLPTGAADVLLRYDWPGNVRELRNTIRDAAIRSRAAAISAKTLRERCSLRARGTPTHSVMFDPAIDTWRDVVTRAWRQYAEAILHLTGRNVSEAAKRAGMSRSRFYEMRGTAQPEKAPPSDTPGQ